jgi:Carboxypeptidase regulatory-like domain
MFRNKIISAILLSCALGATALSARAQILKGRVTDEKNHPVVRAHIQLLREGKIRNRSYSNRKGKYQMWPVDPGYYQALVSVEGYDRIIRDIDLKRTDSTVIDFCMHKKSGLLSR